MSEHSPFEGLGDLKPRHGSFSTRNRSSWKELQIAVKQAKSVQQSLINRVPHSFTFCENKLYFLAVPFGSRENSIHYVDLPSSENGSRDEQNVDFIPLAWKPLLDSFRISRSFSGYSREEQLLRERKRLGAFGITSYDFDETCRRFMFSASSSLYTCTDWRMDEEVWSLSRFPFFLKINFKSFLLIVKMELYLSCENWNDGKNALDVSIFGEPSGNVQCTLFKKMVQTWFIAKGKLVKSYSHQSLNMF